MALEHGATVLAIELARLLSLAETELRLGRRRRGRPRRRHRRRRARPGGREALGHDLSRPHRVVVIGTSRSRPEPDALVRAVRGALTGAQATPADAARRHGGAARSRCAPPRTAPPAEDCWPACGPTPWAASLHLGVGGLCLGPEDYPRSYREGRLALRMPGGQRPAQAAVVYDDLGVYQLLSEVSDLTGVDAFVRRWLGPLLDYDARRGAAWC